MPTPNQFNGDSKSQKSRRIGFVPSNLIPEFKDVYEVDSPQTVESNQGVDESLIINHSQSLPTFDKKNKMAQSLPSIKIVEENLLDFD